MKKFLLSCFLIIAIGANAQFTQNFDAGTSMPTGWMIINGGDANGFLVASASSGAHSSPNIVQIKYNSFAAHDDYLVTPAITVQAGVNDRVTYWTKSLDPEYLEMYDVRLSTTTNEDAAQFTTTLKASSESPGEWTRYVLDLRPYIGQTVYIGFHATSEDKWYLYFDDIVNDAYPAVLPGCTTVTSPVSGAVINAGATTLSWSVVADASAYKVTVGTTSGGNDVYNETVDVTSVSVNLLKNKTYFVKVVPTNAVGDAVGCTETSFSTNNTMVYCTPTVSQYNYLYGNISNVKMADMNHSSVGNNSAYKDYTSVTVNVIQGKTYPIEVTNSSYSASNNNVVAVWIDYNWDGIFSDDERVILTDGAVSTGNITIPDTSLVGTTRMRVRSNILGTIPTPCGTTVGGQTEDFTINIQSTPATLPNCNTITFPVNSSTVPSNTKIVWNAASGTTGYKVSIGTTSGGTEIENNKVVEGLFYSVNLAPFTTYYVRVVPFNDLGDAENCNNEIKFTTSYCIPDSTGDVFAITSVNLNGDNGVTYTSPIGGANGTRYEDFTDNGNAKWILRRGTSSPITVIGDNTSTGNVFAMTVFIDWNRDGDFDDAGEGYFNTDSTLITGYTPTKVTLNGNIQIPDDALLGKTRMRIKYNYNWDYFTVIAAELATSCSAMTNGQVEDYTVDVQENLAVSDVTKANISVYPNPFTEIVKISNIKGVKSISVNDMNGRLVRTLLPAAELNLSNLKSGMYIINLNMEDGSIKSVKVIKE
ncbi:MAG: GEVED domain-containing protein [Bergeyella sp.]